jgi:hypothetical protein
MVVAPVHIATRFQGMHSLNAEQVSSNLTPALMLGYLLGYKCKNDLAWFTSTVLCVWLTAGHTV